MGLYHRTLPLARHPLTLPEIEGSRADKVPHILDEDDRAPGQIKIIHGVADHVGVEMAALPGVDLNGGHAAGTNALGIAGRCLIALDDADRALVPQPADGLDKECRLARARARHQVESDLAARRKPVAVVAGMGIIHRQNALLDLDQCRVTPVVMVGMGFVSFISIAAAAYRTHHRLLSDIVRITEAHFMENRKLSTKDLASLAS